jgi:hypothetical protein
LASKLAGGQANQPVSVFLLLFSQGCKHAVNVAAVLRRQFIFDSPDFLDQIFISRVLRLVARAANEYRQTMKTLTVQEASKSLGDWLRRAVSGEQIAVKEGNFTVLLQPLSQPEETLNRLSAREALRRLQSQGRLTRGQAEDYLREVRAERLMDGRRNGQ